MSLNSNICRVLAGTTLALLLVTLKDWLPGVAGPEPRLGFRFWGVNLRRGLAPAPFFHFRCVPLFQVFQPNIQNYTEWE
jgi:hypothetical protein